MRKSPAQAVLILMSCLVLSGCARDIASPPPAPTLYERLGGNAAISAAVDDAVDNIAADSRINARFGSTGIPHLKTLLVQLICLRSGGPCAYSGLDMSTAHEGLYIRDDEFDDLIEDLSRSLDKFKVPVRERGELLAILGQMRNAVVGH